MCSAARPRGPRPLSPAEVAGRCSSNAEGISSNERGCEELELLATLLVRLFMPGRKGPVLRCGISPNVESAQAGARCVSEKTGASAHRRGDDQTRPCVDRARLPARNRHHLRRCEPEKGACLFLHSGCQRRNNELEKGARTVHVAAREGGSKLREVAVNHDPGPAGEDVAHPAVLLCHRGQGWLFTGPPRKPDRP